MKKYSPKGLHTYTIVFSCAERKFLLYNLMEKTKEKNATFLSTAGLDKRGKFDISSTHSYKPTGTPPKSFN